MRLSITLPADRVRPGRLRLLSGGDVLLDMPCLGKADSGRALKEGNPARDPLKPYGDTPGGTYRAARIRVFDPEHQRMGRYAIPLIGRGGPALKAMDLRTELYIHATPGNDANRGTDRLIPTYGCIRLLDADMEALAQRLGDRLVEIEISEELREV